MSEKYALVIGNSEYTDSYLSKLVTTVQNVNDFVSVLKEPNICGFNNVNSLVNAPLAKINRTIAELFKGKSSDDLLLLYFSGHGILDESGTLYFAVKETEKELPEVTAIPSSFIRERMDSSYSNRIILILDCCYSGAFDRRRMSSTEMSANTKTAFEGNGYGRIVLTATDAVQYAWEGDEVIGEVRNSIFTHYLIQGLRTGEADIYYNGKITVNELFQYIYNQVVRRTPRQTPQKFSYGEKGDLIIALNPNLHGLPVEIKRQIEDENPWVRVTAVLQLEELLYGKNNSLVKKAQTTLEYLRNDNDLRVTTKVKEILENRANSLKTLPQSVPEGSVEVKDTVFDIYASSLIESLRKEQTILGKTLDLKNQYVTLKVLEQTNKPAKQTFNGEKDDYLVMIGSFKTRDISVDKMLSWNAPILLISGAGTGKTTLLKHIAFSLCTQLLAEDKIVSRSIPFIVRLKEFVNSGKTINEFLYVLASELLPTTYEPAKFVETRLQKGQLTILFDGFDEINATPDEIVQKVLSFSHKYSKNRIILASRPVGDELLILKKVKTFPFCEVGIAPLSRDQRRRFIEVYSKNAEIAHSINEILERNVYMLSISTTPIYLMIIIRLYEEGISLHRKAEFYSDATMLLISSWPRKKHLKITYSSTHKYLLLGYISYLITFQKTPFNRRLILRCEQEMNTDAECLLDELLEYSGLIRIIRHNEFEFIHKTFMEYFAAYYLVSRNLAIEKLPEICDRDNIEVYSFVCGIMEDSSKILRYIIESSEPDYYLMAICLSECKLVDEHLQEKAEEMLYDFISESKNLYSKEFDPNRILRIIHLFPKRDNKKNLYQKIIDMLVNPESYVNSNDIEESRLKDSLIAVKTKALRYIVHTQDVESVEVLINELLRQDNDTWIGFKTAAALANIGVESALDALAEAFEREKDGDEDVRMNIVEAIIRTDSHKALPLLQSVLRNSNIVVSQMAEEGIIKINNSDKLGDKVCVDVESEGFLSIKRIYHSNIITTSELIERACTLGDKSRLDAFYLLRETQVTYPLEQLEKILYNEGEKEIFKCESVKIIGLAGTEYANNILLSFYRSFDPKNARENAYARGYAIEYLAYNKYYEAIDIVLQDKFLVKRPYNERGKALWSISDMFRFMSKKMREQYVAIALPVLNEFKNNDPYDRARHWANIALSAFELEEEKK